MKKKEKEALIKISNKKLAASIDNGQRIIIKNEGSRSFSKTFIDFIDPLLQNDILDKDKTKTNLIWGLMVWNKAVAESHPDHRFAKKVDDIYPMFYALNNRPLIREYLLRKHNLFENDAFFIYTFEEYWDENRNMAISVAAIKVDDETKTLMP